MVPEGQSGSSGSSGGSDRFHGAMNYGGVDAVDLAQGPKVVAVLTIDRALDDPKQIATVLSRSPTIVSFLKCDVKLENPTARATTERVCLDIGR